jgi:hypothetical protein
LYTAGDFKNFEALKENLFQGAARKIVPWNTRGGARRGADVYETGTSRMPVKAASFVGGIRILQFDNSMAASI